MWFIDTQLCSRLEMFQDVSIVWEFQIQKATSVAGDIVYMIIHSSGIFMRQEKRLNSKDERQSKQMLSDI